MKKILFSLLILQASLQSLAFSIPSTEGNKSDTTYPGLSIAEVNKTIRLIRDNEGLRFDTAQYRAQINLLTQSRMKAENKIFQDSLRYASKFEAMDMKVSFLQADSKEWEKKYKGAVRFGRFAFYVSGALAATTLYLAMKKN